MVLGPKINAFRPMHGLQKVQHNNQQTFLTLKKMIMTLFSGEEHTQKVSVGGIPGGECSQHTFLLLKSTKAQVITLFDKKRLERARDQHSVII